MNQDKGWMRLLHVSGARKGNNMKLTLISVVQDFLPVERCIGSEVGITSACDLFGYCRQGIIWQRPKLRANVHAVGSSRDIRIALVTTVAGY